jgi:hypothetical protein
MMFDDAIAKFLQTGALMVQSQAVEHEAPYITGRLRGDITVFPQHNAHEIEVGNTRLIDYAVYVYYGTKPHEIKPKRKKALKTPYGTFKKVKHPGTKANPYLDNALSAIVSSGRFERLLGGMGDEMSEEMFDNITASLKNMIVK